MPRSVCVVCLQRRGGTPVGECEEEPKRRSAQRRACDRREESEHRAKTPHKNHTHERHNKGREGGAWFPRSLARLKWTVERRVARWLGRHPRVALPDSANTHTRTLSSRSVQVHCLSARRAELARPVAPRVPHPNFCLTHDKPGCLHLMQTRTAGSATMWCAPTRSLQLEQWRGWPCSSFSEACGCWKLSRTQQRNTHRKHTGNHMKVQRQRDREGVCV
jgi:hypothetical protein